MIRAHLTDFLSPFTDEAVLLELERAKDKRNGRKAG